MYKVSRNRIGKYFSVLKLGYMRNMESVNVQNNIFNKNLSIFLLKQGYINGFVILKNLKIKVFLKYYKGKPLIVKFNMNKESYSSLANFKFKRYYKSINGYSYGFTVYNTSKGFLDVNNCLLQRRKGQFIINMV